MNRPQAHIVLGSTLLALALAACGVRGSLDNPPGVAKDGTATRAAAAKSEPGEPPPKPPHRPFILDGLIR